MKTELSVIQAYNLRELVSKVNSINKSGKNIIAKEDIVDLIKEEGSFFLVYYK